jgi:uncharacterized protein YegP (UPF0339 family)
MPSGDLTTELRKAKDGWRWRMWRGGNIVAESGEAYARKQHCVRALTRLQVGLRQLWRSTRGAWWTQKK